MTEYIHYVSENDDAFECLCGNVPWSNGFFPIEGNTEVDPVPEDWTSNEYVCNRCGRVIDQTTLRVTRHLDISTIVYLY